MKRALILLPSMFALACAAHAHTNPEIEARKTREKPFLEAAAKETGAVVLPSGVVYRSVSEGSGRIARAGDFVTVRYVGKFTDGKIFDASEMHGGTLSAYTTKLVPCWTQGLAKMHTGGKAVLTCPPETAYGDDGAGEAVPGGSTLQFDIELVSVR